jgi:hypothetical protein
LRGLSARTWRTSSTSSKARSRCCRSIGSGRLNKIRRLTSEAAVALGHATAALRQALKLEAEPAPRSNPAPAPPASAAPLAALRAVLDQALSVLDPQVLLGLEHHAATAGDARDLNSFGSLVGDAWAAIRHAWVTITLALAALPRGAEVIQVGDLTVDRAARKARRGGRQLRLDPRDSSCWSCLPIAREILFQHGVSACVFGDASVLVVHC